MGEKVGNVVIHRESVNLLHKIDTKTEYEFGDKRIQGPWFFNTTKQKDYYICTGRTVPQVEQMGGWGVYTVLWLPPKQCVLLYRIDHLTDT